MSTHACRVVKIIDILPHSNADSLEIIPIPGSSWQCVSQKGVYKPGDLAIYIEPDMVVPTTRPEFSWLAKPGDDGKHRLRALRLRGELSFGLLIPCPLVPMIDMDTNEARYPREGDNFMRALGVVRYEPPAEGEDMFLAGPAPSTPKFDVESLSNYPDLLHEGEFVIVTEKIHGTNARYLYQDDTFYIGTRTRWLNPSKAGRYGMAALQDNKSVERWCRAHPGTVLYGEIYPCQSLKYGGKTPLFRAFAAYEPPGVWMMPRDLEAFTVRTVPLVYGGPWNAARVLPYAETDSGVPGAPKGHIMEGIVIQPAVERRDPNIGRVILKHISTRYWTSKHA